MIDDVQYFSPLGKSNHCVLLLKVICYTKTLRNENYNKVNFEKAHEELENLSYYDVDNKWRLIKAKLNKVEDKLVTEIRSQKEKHNFPLDSLKKRKNIILQERQ